MKEYTYNGYAEKYDMSGVIHMDTTVLCDRIENERGQMN